MAGSAGRSTYFLNAIHLDVMRCFAGSSVLEYAEKGKYMVLYAVYGIELAILCDYGSDVWS